MFIAMNKNNLKEFTETLLFLKLHYFMLIHIIKVIKSDHLLGHNGAKGFMITHSNFYNCGLILNKGWPF